MNVRELMQQLATLDPEMEVRVWDGCEDEWDRVPVGVLYITVRNGKTFVCLEG